MNRSRTVGSALVTMALVLASPDARATTIAGAPASPPPPIPTAPGDKLQYYGGRVISNVEIVAVFWTANVNAMVKSQIGAFYSTIVKSSYIDWLTEYDTIGKVGLVDGQPGSNQHIGRGTFFGARTITPTNVKTALTDAEIGVELAAQIQAGHLPPPTLDAGGNVNTLYMIDFPPGVSITLLNLRSCSSFGAYHFTITYGGKSVPYGVHPDCNYSFDTTTLIHAHELIEALTDTEVGLADQLAATTRPIAWATVANNAWDSQEIADICQGMGSDSVVAGFTVQKVWSNYANACVVGVPICDGVMQPPACRPCNKFDSGNACEGASSACATQGTKVGRCVTCTSAYANACTGATPVCDDPTYTCRACKIDSECAAGTVCDTKKGVCVVPPKPMPDAGSGSDSGSGSDAGVGAGDAGANADAGGATRDAGCGCAAVGAPAGARAGGALAIAAVLLARRRRRR